jgi:toxin secretion/phage lysis holin
MDSLNNITFTSRYWIFLLPLVLIAADVVSGWIQATINGTWDSTKMRRGLFRKSAELLILIVAYVIYIAIKLPVDIPAFISIYIIIMEILSVCENLDQAGLPVPTWITRRLRKIAQDMTETDPFDKERAHEKVQSDGDTDH